MNNLITTFKPKIYQESIDNVTDVLSSTWIGTGPKVVEFEDAIGNRLGLKYPVAVSSCTTALEIALKLLEIGGNNNGSYSDEVITTPLTFVATNNSILRAGAVPVFADIQTNTYNIDPDSIKRRINPGNTKAIMVVHMYGHPCDMDRINALGYPVIEDCAHAFDAEYKGNTIGSEDNNIHCYSFQATKNLTTGGGGMISVPTEWMYNKARKLRWFGIDRDSPDRRAYGTYNLDFVGGKANMTDINAAIGLGQLQHIAEDNCYRVHLVELYYKYLDSCRGIKLPLVKEYAKHAWHAFTVKAIRDVSSCGLMEYLAEYDIQTMKLYKPHYQYSRFYDTSRANDLANCRDTFESMVTLPLHMHLTEDNVRYICNITKRFAA